MQDALVRQDDMYNPPAQNDNSSAISKHWAQLEAKGRASIAPASAGKVETATATTESTTWASAVSERTTTGTGILRIHWVFTCVESGSEVGVGEDFVGFVYGCHG